MIKFCNGVRYLTPFYLLNLLHFCNFYNLTFLIINCPIARSTQVSTPKTLFLFKKITAKIKIDLLLNNFFDPKSVVSDKTVVKNFDV